MLDVRRHPYSLPRGVHAVIALQRASSYRDNTAMPHLHPNDAKNADLDIVTSPFNRVEAIKDIEDASRLTVSIADIFRIDTDSYFEPLEYLWQQILHAHVRGAESRFVGAEFLFFELSEEPDDELRALYINVRLWRDAARSEFLSRVRRFTDLRYASREDYSKHLPPLGALPSAAWIDDESRKRDVSIFYRDIPAEDALTAFLHGIFWSFPGDDLSAELSTAEKHLWESLLYNDNSRICFRCTGLIGASKGTPTTFVCFELDATTPIVHAYPVTEDEALQINGVPIRTISELQRWELF
jgi:hypothetical protein